MLISSKLPAVSWIEGPAEAHLCPHPGLRNLDLRGEPAQCEMKCEESVLSLPLLIGACLFSFCY